MKRLPIILIIVSFGFCLFLFCKPVELPATDLASPSQEVRDAAAKILRAKAKPTWKIKWLFFTLHLKKGENETNVVALLKAYNLKTDPEFGMGSLWEYSIYKLDDYWHLECWFDANNVLSRWKLSSGWSEYAIWPSTNFSGVWVNYYANGQKFTECSYKDGLRFGDLITYYPDGVKSEVCHFENGKQNGLLTAYFPSGQIYFQQSYISNEPVGVEVFYNKDGTTNKTINYSHH